MNTKPRLLVATALLAACSPVARAADTVVASPSGKVKATIALDGRKLTFGVTMNGTQVVETSPLIMTIDGAPITEGADVQAPEKYEVNETYPWLGNHTPAVNRAAGVRLPIKSPAGSATLDVRAYDDAVAYRFVVRPAGDAAAAHVPDETSAFILPAGSTVWHHDMNGHYEGVHTRSAVDEVKPGTWCAPPMTFKLANGAGYASITEADLLGYAGMALQAQGARTFAIGLAHKQPPSYPYTLRYSKEDVERLSKPAQIAGTITTPWRVVILGPDLNTLVNSDVVHNLCPPADPKLFADAADWIKPGRAVWRYLDGNLDPATGQVVQRPGAATRTLDPGADAPPAGSPAPRANRQPATAPATRRAGGGGGQRVAPAEIKQWNKLAGQLGFEHNILEGFWHGWSDAELKDVVDDGRSHGVAVWVWEHSRNLRDPASRADFWDRLNRAGVAGTKIDFFDHEAKEVIDLYEAIFRESAVHKILLDFHGANKPTGLQRTFPNSLTYEGVKGMESSRTTNRAQHETTIPFTRCLAGPAEYTVVHFGPRRADTTAAHQIASAAILNSPLLTYAANPANLLESPAVEMIKSIPSTWDQTIVLPGSEIGQVAAYARRKGDTWFLAVMNGPQPSTLSLPLSFLPEGQFEAMTVGDTPDDAGVLQVARGKASRSDGVTLTLQPGGGYIARYSKAP